MRRLLRLAWWARAIALSGMALSAPSHAWAAWKTFTVADGLTANYVLNVVEDHNQNLWFATYGGGISLHDGHRWKRFSRAEGLPSDSVLAGIEDRNGNMWFSTEGAGVLRFDGATWTQFTTREGLASNFTFPIMEDRAGNILVGTTRGVCRFDGFAWATLFSGYKVWAISEDRDGYIWVGTTGGGLWKYDTGFTSATRFQRPALPSDSVYAIAQDRSGAMWVGTRRGLSRYDGSSWRTYTMADGLASDLVRDVLEDRDGDVWAVCLNSVYQAPGQIPVDEGGVSRFNGTTWESHTLSSRVISDLVYSVYEDRRGNLWFGTFSGATRYDRSEWRTFTTADGLRGDDVRWVTQDRRGALWFATDAGATRLDSTGWEALPSAGSDLWSVLEDRAGSLWFGSRSGGAARYDSLGQWYTYSDPSGPSGNSVFSMTEDHSGHLWFCPWFAPYGVSRFDGSTWSLITTRVGLSSDDVLRVSEDRAGDYWFATNGGGVTRCHGDPFLGVPCQIMTTADGLESNTVHSILEDRDGNVWFGFDFGVSRYDPVSYTWRNFTAADGFPDGLHVPHILQDRAGRLWFSIFGTGIGVYDGSTWRTLSVADGLASNDIWSMYEDRSGDLWFATFGKGVSRFTPDRVPPRTIFASVPPVVSPSPDQQAVFGAFGETEGIEYSYRLDGGAWSGWSRTNSWAGFGIADGIHVLEVRSRDFLGNVDSAGIRTTFEVDAQAPAPIIASPFSGQAVGKRVEVRGTASDSRFREYRIEVRPAGATSWDPPGATLLTESSAQVSHGLLASWDTSPFADGLYDIRASVTDSLGLTGASQVSVIVDNLPPFANQTTPAKVTATSGGDVFTTNSELHLYFPPHAFSEDAVVAVTRAPDGSASDTLGNGAILVDPGYDLVWSGGALKKAARLEVACVARPPGVLAIYRSGGGVLERLGGTVEPGKISLTIDAPGRYAVYADGGTSGGQRSVSALSFTPRVFSPHGTYASPDVGIGFTLGRPGTVTVKVYNRSGRLVREVASGMSLSAGTNLVRWDGRDREGGIVTDGLYLVTVEVFGETVKKALAVVK